MKKYVILCLLLMLTLNVAGCSKNKEEELVSSEAQTDDTEPPIEETDPSTSEEEIPEGYIQSKLTGIFVPEEIAINRPYAIMLNNIKDANPQSGIEEAAILYESLVEGGITRLMGVFEELNPERIGSVRSARQYFVSIADEYDGILVSFGESSYATEKIAELKVDQLSGLSGEGSKVFYRDSSIKAPHNAFASKDGILEGTNVKDYRQEYQEELSNHFTFYNEDTELSSDQSVNKITLKYSNYTSPYFTYDSENKLYLRYQHGGEHIDANSNKQLSFKNLIIQFVDGFSVDEDRSFSFKSGSGEGLYISNGKAVPLTWDKVESTRKMVYYDSDKNMLKVNPGKTYIAIFPGKNAANVILE